MRNRKEAFLEELEEMFDAETQLEQLLSQRAQEIQDTDIEHFFWQHKRETQQQIHNLRRCFAVLGVSPRRGVCLALEHWKKEHDSLLHNWPYSTAMVTMFDLSEARHLARYEIASYQGLIRQAKTLGENTCVKLLQQNLSQEEQMARQATHLAQQFAPLLRPE